ncbi:putative Transcriptional Regulator, Fis family [Nostoc sp. NIES-3756]|uniref:WD40 domain-containing protein n=1 Tax=Nostoc sp. NIES-3756 TaxID=1751286 RepID=UPI00071F5037|nr:NB-ARC domain-containing protein [Nostoc sp. NIES-3756]BAT52195.1 putative Transcriptional Regulator, Fis family [Nostoc sp. NIES-3756]
MMSAADMFQPPDDFIADVANKYGVTPTELDALILALNNYSGAEIADKLKISQPAVRKRLGESYRKLGITGSYNKKIYELRQKLSHQYYAVPKNYPSHQDWGEAVDVEGFRGREEELLDVEEWISGNNPCRLVALLGMGGIGKTVLAAMVAKKVQPKFDYLIWRSLRNAPQLEDILTQLLRFLPNDNEDYLTDSENNKILRLIEILRQHRCLIILDNVESILRSGEGKTQEWAGEYQPEYKNYGYLFKKVAEAAHDSCLILTSREKPKEVAALEGKNLPVKVLQLSSLHLAAAREILSDKGCICTNAELEKLVNRYSGNPLALKIVATTIYDLFNNKTQDFLNQIEQESAVYGDIRILLEQQFNRLSELEKQVMYWLAINRDFVYFYKIKEDLTSTESAIKILEVLESLLRRSLIEKKADASKFGLQSVVMEYVNEQIIEQASEEISQNNKLDFINTYPLMKARSRDEIRQTQERLILEPVKQKLLNIFGNQLEIHLVQMLKRLQKEPLPKKGYAAGNLINLLRQLQINHFPHDTSVDLSGRDFSGLNIWQAYFQDVKLRETIFTNSDLSSSLFKETMSSVVSVRFSPDGRYFATGLMNGEIRLWQTADNKQLCIYKGHTAWVWAFAFSPDNKILASGSADYTIRLWDVETGECLETLKGHTNKVYSVAFSPDGKILASAGEDETIKLWDMTTRTCQNTLVGHEDWVWSVTFQPFTADDKSLLLVSSGADSNIKLWDISTGKCWKTLQGHTQEVYSVHFSPDGKTLASSSEDSTIKLWDLKTGKCQQTLLGHNKKIYSVRFSPDGKTLASCGEDRTIRLWDTAQGECLHILKGHSSQVWAIAFSPDGRTLVSCSDDQTARLWDVATGKPLNILQGYTRGVYSVAFSPDSRILASGRDDHTIVLWDLSKKTDNCYPVRGHQGRIRSVAFHPDGQILASGSADNTIKLWHITDIRRSKLIRTLPGHSNWVWTVVFSPDKNTLASSSEDRTIRVWDITTGECLQKLRGHSHWVWTVAFSPDGRTLASGSAESEIRIWDVASGECLQILTEHQDMIWSVAFSPDGQYLASASEDKTIKLWKLDTFTCVHTLTEHSQQVHSVAFSPNGQLLASGSADTTVKLWEVSTGECIDTLQHRHTAAIRTVAFSRDGKLLASGSEDEMVQLWDMQNRSRLRSLKSPRLYEDMDITDIKGVTDAEKASLKMLGAVEKT